MRKDSRLPKKKTADLEIGDIIQLPLLQNHETVHRPVVLEAIKNGLAIYRPITDAINESGRNKRNVVKIQDRDHLLLTKDSAVAIGTRRAIEIKKLPTNVKFYGHMGQRDKSKISKYDDILKENIDNIRHLPDTYQTYVSTRNHANAIEGYPFQLEDPKGGMVNEYELHELSEINFDIRVIENKTVAPKPISRNFKKERSNNGSDGPDF